MVRWAVKDGPVGGVRGCQRRVRWPNHCTWLRFEQLRSKLRAEKQVVVHAEHLPTESALRVNDRPWLVGQTPARRPFILQAEISIDLSQPGP